MSWSCMFERFRFCKYPFFSNMTHEAANSEEEMHAHDFPQIWYCIRGKYTHVVDYASYKLGAGSIVIVPPGTQHGWNLDSAEECDIVQVNLMLNFFDDIAEYEQFTAIMHMFLAPFSKELGFSAVRLIELDEDERPYAEKVFCELASQNWREENKKLKEIKKMFYSIFALPYFYVSAEVRRAALCFYNEKYIPLIRAVYYMNINYSRHISISELLSLSHMCQTDFFKRIKKVLSCTYSAYLQTVRVRHAAVLCTFSRYSLQYISDICGFGDLSYMTRQFKKHLGVLPKTMKSQRKIAIPLHTHLNMNSVEGYENVLGFFYSYGLKKGKEIQKK